MNSNIEIEIFLYRGLITILCLFWTNIVGHWITVVASFLAFISICYQYYMSIPYFNQEVSTIWGSLIFIYTFILLNGITTLIFGLKGVIIVILCSAPLIVLGTKYFRHNRISRVLIASGETMNRDIDNIIQIQTLQNVILSENNSESEILTLVGFINLHANDCHSIDCPCNPENQLFDPSSEKTSDRTSEYHKDKIFLLHFNKKMYEDGINKFGSKPSLHLAYSSFLFENLKNIHAALVELEIAEKLRPSLLQRFMIFRYKNKIEDYIKQETLFSKDMYAQLPNVIEFENIFNDLQKAIEKVTNFQIEFWTQLSNVMPDLNILNELNSELFKATKETEELWNKLCQINPNYIKAFSLYGSYLNDIKNNHQQGFDLIEKAKLKNTKKPLDEMAKSSEALFADDTAVIHISGEKEAPGRILKTNQGFTKIFGYTKSDAIGQNVSMLMPSLFGIKHKEFMEKYFRIGKKLLYEHERILYAQHRNGDCFQMKIMVKQIPYLSEGIQYVGMIRPTKTEYDYILTDMKGVINSFSNGIASLLTLNNSFFTENQINIQVIAPELMKVFAATEKNKLIIEKFKETGGQKITIFVPKDFANFGHSYNKKANKSAKSSGDDHKGSSDIPIYKHLNKALKKSNGIAKQFNNIKTILETNEYKNAEVKQTVRCEIHDLTFELAKDQDPLKIKEFKIGEIGRASCRERV